MKDGDNVFTAAFWWVSKRLFWLSFLTYFVWGGCNRIVANCDSKFTVKINGKKYCTDTWPNLNTAYEGTCYTINGDVICGTLKIYPRD